MFGDSELESRSFMIQIHKGKKINTDPTLPQLWEDEHKHVHEQFWDRAMFCRAERATAEGPPRRQRHTESFSPRWNGQLPAERKAPLQGGDHPQAQLQQSDKS